MRALPRPTNEQGVAFVPSEVFVLCISRVRNPNLRQRLQGIRHQIEDAAIEYELAAAETRLHEIARPDNIGGVNKAEMMAVYTDRMVPNTQPGRPVYNRILNNVPFGRCPLCDVGVVTTLDHHLPKSQYLAVTVTPDNLVPACTWCQDAKDEAFPLTPGQQTLHPYFDDFESETWLHTAVIEGTPASFQFSVQAPAGWGATTIERLNRHLTIFNLPRLYSSNAADELLNMRKRLSDLYQAGGAELVRAHLVEEAASRRAKSLNSWQTATYQAAATSDWFCNGGFALI
jgi:5-methylcytosine-specific restriction endonuclease McrA